jgi:iron complex outermembrane receptor protein
MRLLMLGILVSTGVAGNVVLAADDDQQPVLETIVVTAQKREENLQDVPISMEVLTAEKLATYNVTDILSMQTYVPNLLVQQATVPAQFFIRGFGSQAANDAFDQSVSVYVDGVYGGRNRQFMSPFFDVDQVEVLRGPQGALLGKNTAAGAINITTASPTDTFQGAATASYDFDRNGVDLFSYVSGPITDTLNGRLAVHADDTDGWVHNIGTDTYDPGNQTREIRPSLEFKPMDGIDIIGKFDYSSIYDTGNNLIQTSTTTYTVTTTKNEPTPFGIPENDRTTTTNGSLTGRFAVGPDTLETITGYSAYDNTYHLGALAGAPEEFVVGFVSSFDQLSQEIRLVSPTHQTIEYIVGAYYDESTFNTANASTYNFGYGFAGQVQTVFEQHANTWSGFGQATWNVVDGLRVLGSVRYTRETKSANFAEYTEYGVPIATALPLSGTEAEDHTDPTATLQYDVTPNIMLYATYGQGSKAGGFVSNTRTVVASDFKFAPEQSRNYEAGIKSTFFDKRVLLDLSIYDTRFKDLQVTTFDPTLITYVTSNAAAATSKGAEWSVAWVLTKDWKVSSSGAYLDAKYDNYPGAECLTTTPAAQCSATGTTNLAGTTLLGASTWTGNVALDFNHPLTDNLKLSASAVASYRSGYTIATTEDPAYGYQPGFVKIDGNIAITRGAWSVALIGKNLADKLTKNFAYDFSGVGVADVDPTRSVMAQVRVRF